MTDWIDAVLDTSLVRGAAELEQTDRGLLIHRLPAHARALADPQLAMVEEQPAGVRVAFRTRADRVVMTAHRTTVEFAGVPPRPDSAYDVVVDGELIERIASTGGDRRVLDPSIGGVETHDGPATVLDIKLSSGEHDVEIWLPHYERLELIGLRADAPVQPLPPRTTWLHYGSSVSQGSNAIHPTDSWPVVSARAAGVDLVNLGFGGSALLDPFVARVMRDTPADVVSVELGINIVNADLMRRRAFGPAVDGFLDTIRDGHPDAPLLVVSSVYCPIHEKTPGPGAFDPEEFAVGRLAFQATGDPEEVAAGRLTLEVVREDLRRIVDRRRADDPHIAYLDGLELFGPVDHEREPLPDRLHPTAAAHRLIGARFADHGLSR
ncbi:SGNH/GDSL hydrolase family protein [Aeromicrobium piscarium]|uniref:SGNH/GDSL hydrolase family protein n=1 Tax=Aeromicrobium piscarium TaxID=2590901 RepID=UPI001FEB0325|nr:SGNH/GDSL hydrolase family protein [Aeromicrobium piscarium]